MNHIKNLTSKNRSRDANARLGLILAFVAGAINAGGFLAIGEYTSHMTGMLSSIADYIALNKFYAAFISLAFVISFICGAATCAIIVNWARTRQYHSEFSLPLMLEAILLLVFSIAAADLIHHNFILSINVTIALLCFIMGLQNAIITKISKSEIRTTHITGLATDVGIELGKILFLLPRQHKTIEISKYKLELFSGLILMFLFGGIIGAICFKNFGYVTTIPISILLVIIAMPPIIDDIKTKKG